MLATLGEPPEGLGFDFEPGDQFGKIHERICPPSKTILPLLPYTLIDSGCPGYRQVPALSVPKAPFLKVKWATARSSPSMECILVAIFAPTLVTDPIKSIRRSRV